MNSLNKKDIPIISIKELTIEYEGKRVLNKVDLDLERGSVYGIIGPSGCGKTTLFKTIVGLIKPVNGEIIIHDQKISDDFNIGYMPQINALYDELTVLQHLQFFARMYGLNENIKRESAVKNILKTVSLDGFENRKISKLSGGEKQRVSLGIAMSIITFDMNDPSFTTQTLGRIIRMPEQKH